MKQMIYHFEKSNLNQFEYWFDSKKISDINTIKQKFQQLFQNTTIPATRTASVQTEVFETIWANIGTKGNNGLRQSLFPINNTQILKPNALSEFIQMVNTLDNKLFNFIKVK